jgi:hypothetical protein
MDVERLSASRSAVTGMPSSCSVIDVVPPSQSLPVGDVVQARARWRPSGSTSLTASSRYAPPRLTYGFRASEVHRLTTRVSPLFRDHTVCAFRSGLLRLCPLLIRRGATATVAPALAGDASQQALAGLGASHPGEHLAQVSAYR